MRGFRQGRTFDTERIGKGRQILFHSRRARFVGGEAEDETIGIADSVHHTVEHIGSRVRLFVKVREQIL